MHTLSVFRASNRNITELLDYPPDTSGSVTRSGVADTRFRGLIFFFRPLARGDSVGSGLLSDRGLFSQADADNFALGSQVHLP